MNLKSLMVRELKSIFLLVIRGGSSTDESLLTEGERTRSTSHRERENTRIYICVNIKEEKIQRTEIEM
jgi:hypothetical protein